MAEKLKTTPQETDPDYIQEGLDTLEKHANTSSSLGEVATLLTAFEHFAETFGEKGLQGGKKKDKVIPPDPDPNRTGPWGTGPLLVPDYD